MIGRRSEIPRAAVAGLCVLIFVASWTTSLLADRPGRSLVESTRVAVALAQRGEFADPFSPMPTGPTAHVAPVYPAVASLVFRALGETPAAHEVLYQAAAISLAGQAALLPWLTCVAGLGASAGIFGAVLALIAAPTPAAQWESNHVGLLMIVLTGLIAGGGRSGRADSSRRDLVVAGLWGLLILAYPVAVAVWVFWLGREVWWIGRAGPWRRVGVLALVPVLILLPWLVRNQLALGGPVFVRNNLGIELGVSFNPCADVSLFDNMLTGCFKRTHPDRSPAQAARVRALGELAYNRAQLASALAFVRSEPARSARLIAGRFGSFWLPSPIGDPWREVTTGGRRRESAMVFIATLLSLAGLVVVLRRRIEVGPLLAAWFLLLPLPYFVVQFSLRYRTPMLWVTFLLAGVALSASTSGWHRRARDGGD